VPQRREMTIMARNVAKIYALAGRAIPISASLGVVPYEGKLTLLFLGASPTEAPLFSRNSKRPSTPASGGRPLSEAPAGTGRMCRVAANYVGAAPRTFKAAPRQRRADPSSS
jgi:hypothetical protein